jgi:UDP-N-acetylmuramoyl-L-alanyl-D-glutamate--2,6-diaminopimelate ligase
MNKLQPFHRTLSGLLSDICPVSGNVDRELSSLSIDSRTVSKGALFLACPGTKTNGKLFIPEAIAKGAAAVLYQADTLECNTDPETQTVLIGLPELLRLLPTISSSYYGNPSQHLQLIGITGTNGKSTITQLTSNLLSQLYGRAAQIGTLGQGFAGEELARTGSEAGTTPDAITVQRLLAHFVTNNAKSVVMEVSSHGLDQWRVSPDHFSAVLFSNFTRDHLDYHGTLEEYLATKRRLFQGKNLRLGVVNMDDVASLSSQRFLARGVSCLSYSIENEAADIHAKQISYQSQGVSFLCATPWGEVFLEVGLLGAFNVSNLLGALTLVLGLHPEPLRVLESLPEFVRHLASVTGRMQVICTQPVMVVVDYAHTPSGLEQAIRALRVHTNGEIICIFGCGGDRDSGKRSEMGRVAQAMADKVVVTSDNPRTEDPQNILGDILIGMESRANVTVVTDRSEAIRQTILSALAGSIVLIAGKGHEQGQIVGVNTIHFSDAEEAGKALKQRLRGAA